MRWAGSARVPRLCARCGSNAREDGAFLVMFRSRPPNRECEGPSTPTRRNRLAARVLAVEPVCIRESSPCRLTQHVIFSHISTCRLHCFLFLTKPDRRLRASLSSLDGTRLNRPAPRKRCALPDFNPRSHDLPAFRIMDARKTLIRPSTRLLARGRPGAQRLATQHRAIDLVSFTSTFRATGTRSGFQILF